MRVMPFLLLWAVVFASCGVDEAEAPTQAVAAREDGLVFPTSPIDVRRWLIAGNEFFPTRTSRSAYLVVMQDPSDAARFLAWGFDVRSGACTFFGTGNRTRDLNDLITEVARESQIGVAYDFEFTHGIAIAVGKKPDPAPPIGRWNAWGEMAWKSATQVEAATHFSP
jgi:hypothetical protein